MMNHSTTPINASDTSIGGFLIMEEASSECIRLVKNATAVSVLTDEITMMQPNVNNYDSNSYCETKLFNVDVMLCYLPFYFD